MLANGLTFTRAGLGVGSVVESLRGEFVSAIILLGLALLTEIDGRIARKYHAESVEGAYRDYYADAICVTALFAWRSLLNQEYFPGNSPFLEAGYFVVLSGIIFWAADGAAYANANRLKAKLK